MTNQPVAPAPPQLNAIGVVVTDLARAIEFYTALGCRFVDPTPSDGHTEADLGGMKLMFDTQASVEQLWPDTKWSSPGRVAFAAQCASAKDVDLLHGELAKLGGGSVHEPFDAPWGMRYATVGDPDGTSIDLYAPL